jgi:thioredoxin 1
MNVNDAKFVDEVLQSEKPVVVDFWAPGCIPCQELAPVLEDMAAKYPDIKVVKMECSQNPLIPSKYFVMGVPTLMAFKGGNVVYQRNGIVDAQHVEELFKSL